MIDDDVEVLRARVEELEGRLLLWDSGVRELRCEYLHPEGETCCRCYPVRITSLQRSDPRVGYCEEWARVPHKFEKLGAFRG